MIRTRQDLETIETQMLAPYAVKSLETQGRVFKEKEAEDRTCFQRDRNRVIYSKAFMRLKGKTQVVLAGHGDHFRTRITHSHYVATVSRDICRRLGLNEDLAETIGLAHDLGHTCFGHEGQDALDEVMQEYGSHFEHNEQSLRIVEKLEKKSDLYEGLNLSYEVLDGIDKHRTAYDNPASRDHKHPSLEAQVVNIGDEIAYKYHDLDDGLRAGVIIESELEALDIWKKAQEELSKLAGSTTSNLRSKVMEMAMQDLLETTQKNLTQNKIQSVEDVYQMEELMVTFSPHMRQMLNELGSFLHSRFYKSPAVKEYNDQGRKTITFLFRKLYDDTELIPDEYKARMAEEERHILVKDYVAGMTDAYAMKLYHNFQRPISNVQKSTKF